MTGHLRTAWAAVIDVQRAVQATRTAQTIAQVKAVLRRLHAARHGGKAAPLFIFNASYSAAALTDELASCPAHILARLYPPAASYPRTRPPGPARTAAPPTAAQRSTAWKRKSFRPPPRGAEAGDGRSRFPRPRSLREALVLPDTPLFGTVRAEAWHDVHPQARG